MATIQMMSISPELRLPRLDSDLDSYILSRPERRQATARLRQAYTDGQDDKYEDDKRLIRERTKFAEQMKLLRAFKILHEKDTNSFRKENNTQVDKAFRRIWQHQIHKTNLPQRLKPTKKLDIATPQLRQPICSRNLNPAPMFRSTSAFSSSDKEKRRMHFISTDWKSEEVSWLRFHNTDLRDIHKLGWI